VKVNPILIFENDARTLTGDICKMGFPAIPLGGCRSCDSMCYHMKKTNILYREKFDKILFQRWIDWCADI
jgi:hypothetical protein